MDVHLVDGTYELFRAYYGVPSFTSPDGQEVGATLGLARSLLMLVRDEGATHVAVAFDHEVESFRNRLFDGYKTGEGIEPELFSQFGPAEEITRALGMVVWPMVEHEADDALATGAARFRHHAGVRRIHLCTPDKDLTQCVRGDRVVCVDRRRKITRDEDGVRERFGVSPGSIPDYLALVGDPADGIPGIRGWGAKSSSRILAEYEHLEAIPPDDAGWAVDVRGAGRLASNLREDWKAALLYRDLATLREDVPLGETLEDLAWRGALGEPLRRMCRSFGDESLLERVPGWSKAGG